VKPTTLDLFEPPEQLAEPRSTLLRGQPIEYLLKRSAKRRRIVLTVDDRGLVVHVPWRTSERAISQVIAESESWILRKLAEWHGKKPHSRAWTSGELLDFLGRQLRLELREHSGPAITQLRDDAVLEILLAAPHAQSHVREAVLKWYRRHALAHLSDRVQHYCAKLEVPPPRVFLSSARTRWGSCNAEREVRLNWRLMQAAHHVIDYVVAHEVAHLQVMSHSSRFWRLVQRLHPDYEAAKAELDAMGQHYMALG
jgi:predicted metal-dependent hydrolase